MQAYQHVQHAAMAALHDDRMQFELATLPMAPDMQLLLERQGDGTDTATQKVRRMEDVASCRTQ